MRYKESGKRFCDEINNFCMETKLKCALVTGGGYAYDSIKYIDDEVPNKDFDFMIVYENKKDIRTIILKLKEETQFEFETRFLQSDVKQVEDGSVDIIRLSGKYRQFKSTINLVPVSLVRKIASLQEGNIRKIAHGRNTSLFFANGTNGNRITTIFFSPFFKTPDNEVHYIHLDFTCKKEEGHLFLGILADAVLKGYSKQYDGVGFQDLRICLIKNIYNYLVENGTEDYRYETLFANWNYFSDSVKKYLSQEFWKLNQVDKKEVSLARQYTKTYFLLDKDYKPTSSAFAFRECETVKCSLKEYIFSMQNSEYTRQYLIDSWGKFLAAVYYECGACGNETFSQLKTFSCKNEIDKYVVYGVNDIYYDASDSVSYKCLLYFLKWMYNAQSNLNYEFIRCIIHMIVDFFELIMGIDVIELNEFWSDQEIEFLKRLAERTVIQQYTDVGTFEEVAMLHNINSKVMDKYTKEEGKFLSQYFVDRQGTILDVMCGVGRIANELCSMQYDNVYGIDQYDYVKLGVEKNFKFIKSTIEDFSTEKKFKYIVCLYNCYSNIAELQKVLEKIYEISADDTVVVIDIFNKQWRDCIDAHYYYILKTPGECTVELIREYNSPLEKTIYKIFKNKELINKFSFEQSFFDENELEKLFLEKWNFQLVNSQDANTRHNAQKLIYILRKKNK